VADDVKIPGAAIDDHGTDLLVPLQKLLTGINALGSSNDSTGGAFQKPSQAVAIIESGATALTKWWSGAVGAVGGATAITAAITKFWSGQHGDVRIALLATTGGVLVAVAIALAVIVSSDVHGRAMGAAAIYATRAQVTSTMLELICRSQKPPAEGGAAALSPAVFANAASEGAKTALAPLSDQLSGLNQQLMSMDKRTALIVLGAAQLQSAGKTVAVSNSANGVTGELQDVFVGAGPNGQSDVQVNVNDPESQSVKAIPLEDVIDVQVRPR